MLGVIPLLLTLFAAESSADTSGRILCNPGGGQVELNVCAYEEFVAADQALNKTYQALLRKERADAHYIAKLRLAQKAWIAFRDAELEATFACAKDDPRDCWGSIYPVAYNAVKTRLTNERNSRLAEILKKGRPADGIHD